MRVSSTLSTPIRARWQDRTPCRARHLRIAEATTGQCNARHRDLPLPSSQGGTPPLQVQAGGKKAKDCTTCEDEQGRQASGSRNKWHSPRRRMQVMATPERRTRQAGTECVGASLLDTAPNYEEVVSYGPRQDIVVMGFPRHSSTAGKAMSIAVMRGVQARSMPKTCWGKPKECLNTHTHTQTEGEWTP